MVLDKKYSVPPYFTQTDRLTKLIIKTLNVTSSGFAKSNVANLYREDILLELTLNRDKSFKKHNIN